MPEIRERLLTCFLTVFPGLTESEVPRATLASVAGWDSLAHTSLVTLIEEEFGIEVASEDLEELVSFELMLAHITDSFRSRYGDHSRAV